MTRPQDLPSARSCWFSLPWWQICHAPLTACTSNPMRSNKNSTCKQSWTKPVPTSCNLHSSSCSGSMLTYHLGSLYLLRCSCAPPFTQAPYLSGFQVGLHPLSHRCDKGCSLGSAQAPQQSHKHNFSSTILAFLMLFYINGGITFAG